MTRDESAGGKKCVFGYLFFPIIINEMRKRIENSLIDFSHSISSHRAVCFCHAHRKRKFRYFYGVTFLPRLVNRIHLELITTPIPAFYQRAIRTKV